VEINNTGLKKSKKKDEENGDSSNNKGLKKSKKKDESNEG